MNFCKKIYNFFKKKKTNNFNSEYNYNSQQKFNCVNINNIIKRNLIPLNCFYIIVDKLTYDINVSINSFKEHNEKFKVNVLNFTYDEFFRHKYTYKILQELKLENVKCLSKEQLICVINSFKYKLLYDYGGIILNNCTYTLKDLSSYLNTDSFIYSSINNDYCIHKNYCFMGAVKNYKGLWDTVYPPMDYNMKNYETIKLMFYCNKLYKDMYVFNNLKLNCPVWDFSV
jgi:hypothetical protein